MYVNKNAMLWQKKQIESERRQGVPAAATPPDDSVQGIKGYSASSSLYHQNIH